MTTRFASQTSAEQQTTGEQTVAPVAHTPGPWFAEQKVGRGHWLTTGAPGHHDYIAMVCRREDEAEEDANAALFLAAPQLLAALKALHLQALQSTVNDPANEWGAEALEMSRAAIAAAEGRS